MEPGIPKYPAFTGHEPCASVGSELFCTDEKDFTHYPQLNKICSACPLLVSCFNWALHNEDHNYWGASSAIERKELRRSLKIVRKRSVAA